MIGAPQTSLTRAHDDAFVDASDCSYLWYQCAGRTQVRGAVGWAGDVWLGVVGRGVGVGVGVSPPDLLY